MNEELMSRDFIVLSQNASVSKAREISPGKYVVIVDPREAPVALANQKDIAALDQPDKIQLVKVVRHLPRAMVAGHGVPIDLLVKAAISKPETVARGTVLMDSHGVTAILPIEDLISHLIKQGSGFASAIEKLVMANTSVGHSERGWSIPGRLRRRCIWVVCARCGRLNCLRYIPAKGEVMPFCVNKEPPHRFEMKR